MRKRKKGTNIRGKLICKRSCTKQDVATFIKSKIKEDILGEQHLNILFNERETENVFLRCSKCFQSHFSYPKFCKLVLMKKNHKDTKTKEPTELSIDDVNLIKEKIRYLENLGECTQCSKDISLKSIKRNTRGTNVIKLKEGHKK